MIILITETTQSHSQTASSHLGNRSTTERDVWNMIYSIQYRVGTTILFNPRRADALVHASHCASMGKEECSLGCVEIYLWLYALQKSFIGACLSLEVSHKCYGAVSKVDDMSSLTTLGLPLTISFKQEKIMDVVTAIGFSCAANSTGRELKDAPASGMERNHGSHRPEKGLLELDG